MSDCIAHAHFTATLDTTDNIAHIACFQFLARLHIETQHTDFVGVIVLLGADKHHVVVGLQRAVHYAEITDDTAERIEHRVEHQRLQRCRLVALRRRDTVHYGIKYCRHTLTCLGAARQDFLSRATQQVYNLVGHLLGHSAVKVNLVHHGNDLKIVLERKIEVAYSLRLNALRGVDHQQSALAGGNGTAHLIAEVDVTWSVNEVEHIILTTTLVVHLDGVALDGDATFLFQVHIVEHLPLGHGNGLRVLQQTVCQRTLPVVDMGNNAEVSYVLHIKSIYSEANLQNKNKKSEKIIKKICEKQGSDFLRQQNGTHFLYEVSVKQTQIR